MAEATNIFDLRLTNFVLPAYVWTPGAVEAVTGRRTFLREKTERRVGALLAIKKALSV